MEKHPTELFGVVSSSFIFYINAFFISFFTSSFIPSELSCRVIIIHAIILFHKVLNADEKSHVIDFGQNFKFLKLTFIQDKCRNIISINIITLIN